MKYIPSIAAGLLGILFIASGLVVLLHVVPMPPQKEGSPEALFMGALVPTGYLAFVKVLEIAGGLLVAIPRTRCLGLLILGPIIINILTFHVFLAKGVGLFEPPLVIIVALTLYVFWTCRKPFLNLVR
jgi:putative oxidoreductase